MNFMNIKMIVLTGASLVISSSSAHAQDNASAANELKGPAQTSNLTGADNSNSSPAGAAASTPSVHASLGKKAVSFLAGSIAGTPICIVRRSKYEEWYGVHSMVGESKHKFARAVASTFWLPFAICTGTIEAPFDATANALMYSSRPFSKDQFSLGKLQQNN
jgi:hypothetical protein